MTFHSDFSAERHFALSDLPYDDFEKGLLAILRYLQDPNTDSWKRAFVIAVERWGESTGLSVAYLMVRLVDKVQASRMVPMQVNDPLDTSLREWLTVDELMFLEMIHHMRRDNTSRARSAVDRVTGGLRDAGVIQSALRMAHRYPVGDTSRRPMKPVLRVV